MRKLLGIGAFLGFVTLCGPAQSAGTVNVCDITSLVCAGVDGSNNLKTTGTVGTVTTITNPVGVKGADGSAISSVSNPFPIEGSFAAESTTSGQTGSLQMGAVTTAPPTYTTGKTDPLGLDTHGAQRVVCQDTAGTVCDFTSATLTIQTSQYPSGATPIGGNSTGTTGSVVGTLAGTGGKTTYICGFNVSATGTLTVGPIVVAGLKTASQTYQLVASAGGVLLNISYGSVCIPASAVNTAITVTTTADASATAVDVNSWGYQL